MLTAETGWVEDVVRAMRPERVPVVLTRQEVAAILDRMSGRNWLMASLMYYSARLSAAGVTGCGEPLTFSRIPCTT